jgi:flagellar biogenesis protein FliO
MIFLLGLLTGMLLFTLFLIWYLRKEEKGNERRIKTKRK